MGGEKGTGSCGVSPAREAVGTFRDLGRAGIWVRWCLSHHRRLCVKRAAGQEDTQKEARQHVQIKWVVVKQHLVAVFPCRSLLLDRATNPNPPLYSNILTCNTSPPTTSITVIISVECGDECPNYDPKKSGSGSWLTQFFLVFSSPPSAPPH